jgi:hypothetical protein
LLKITLGLSQSVTNFSRHYYAGHAPEAPLVISGADERRQSDPISAAKVQSVQVNAMASCKHDVNAQKKI